MPEQAPVGFTRIEDAVAKWGKYRSWWYEQVREGRLVGYKSPLFKGTLLKDEEVAAYIAIHPIERDGESQSS